MDDIKQVKASERAPSTLGVRFGTSRKLCGVASLREASDVWCRYRDAHGLGASEAPRVTVVDYATSETVARISYNGRLWHPTTGAEIPA